LSKKEGSDYPRESSRESNGGGRPGVETHLLGKKRGKRVAEMGVYVQESKKENQQEGFFLSRVESDAYNSAGVGGEERKIT